MEITDLAVGVRHTDPDPSPNRDAIQSLPGSGNVTVTVTAANGTTGSGTVGFGRIQGAPDVLAALIECELQPLVVGSDLAWIRRTHRRLRDETEYHGANGLARFGIAAVDTALWDCLGRIRDVPCWQLWGGATERIPAYAMVGWLNFTPDEVAARCKRAVEQGFRGVKLKVGAETLAADVRRIEAVRDAVGPEIDVMVDANQSLTVAEAIRRGHRFAELDCAWFEEPIPAENVHDYATLVDAVAIPIATGENLYSRGAFARFLREDAVDIVQPDLRRMGGPSAMRSVGTMAAAFNREYASHGGGPVQANVMASIENASYLETGFVTEDTPFEVVDGAVAVPQGAGFSWM